MDQPAENDTPLRILILTVDAGFGHRSAAKAVADALEEKYDSRCQVDIVNPFDDQRAPFLLRESQSDYDKVIRTMPDLYRFGYDFSDGTISAALVESALIILLYDVLHDILEQYQPNVILTTYPLYQAPLTAIFNLTRRYIPLYTVITDLVTVHRLWFHILVDGCLVPTPGVFEMAVDYGIAPETVVITGIPVNPAFGKVKSANAIDKAALRTQLGWRNDLPLFLAVGSRRVDNLVETLNVFNHYGQPIQLAVVAGKDMGLYRMLHAINWHVPVYLYEYIENLAPMMHAADALVSKAGGLIVTEALACGLPLMLIDVLPGQETGNAEYVVSNNAGDLARTPLEVLKVISHWLIDDQCLLRKRADTAHSLGKPDAAYQIADLLWDAAKRTLSPEGASLTDVRARRPFVLRSHVLELLERRRSPGIGITPLINDLFTSPENK